MVKNYLKRPFFLASLILIFVFYSGFFKIPEKNKFVSLIPADDVCMLQIRLLSSPSKCENGKYYSSTGFVLKTADEAGKKSSASGKIKVYIPSESVEAYFPGKLYSAAEKKGAFLFETGGIYSFEGKNSKSGFYAEKCLSSFWENN